ncbi:lysylphosphatidylglycerol synthase transmembrane domain-containing protein [Thermodesulfobacteriota bacterium]
MNRNNLKKNTNWKLWSGLFISALFLYLACRHVEFKKTADILLSSNIFYLMLAVLICVIQFFIRAWRWRILLNPLKNTGFLNRFLAGLIGFAANCVLPARLGEFIRADSLGQVEKISKSSVFATIVIERLFDGFSLLLFLVLGLTYTTFPDNLLHISKSLQGSAIFLFFAYLLLIIFIIGFKYRTDQFIKIIDKALFFISSKLRKKLTEIIINFSRGFSPIKGVSSWVMLIFWSVLLWSLSLFQIQFVESSIGIELPFIATFIILSMASLGVAIPSAPGFIGTFHLSVQYGFMFYAVSSEEALSAAILLHATFFFPTILLGCFAFIMMQSRNGKIDIKKMTEASPPDIHNSK